MCYFKDLLKALDMPTNSNCSVEGLCQCLFLFISRLPRLPLLLCRPCLPCLPCPPCLFGHVCLCGLRSARYQLPPGANLNCAPNGDSLGLCVAHNWLGVLEVQGNQFFLSTGVEEQPCSPSGMRCPHTRWPRLDATLRRLLGGQGHYSRVPNRPRPLVGEVEGDL